MTTKNRQIPLGIHADYWLVQQYLQGEQDVWNVLYRQAYPAVKRYLYHQKSMDYLPASDAEDLLSEAFLRSQLYAHRFQGRSSFSGWVCGIVRYAALDAVTKRIREDQKFSILKNTCQPGCTYDTPESLLLLQERNHYLWLAYDLLPEHHKVLIGCLVLGSHTCKEVRRVTGLRRKTSMEEELDLSLAVFKKFYLALYGR